MKAISAPPRLSARGAGEEGVGDEVAQVGLDAAVGAGRVAAAVDVGVDLADLHRAQLGRLGHGGVDDGLDVGVLGRGGGVEQLDDVGLDVAGGRCRR